MSMITTKPIMIAERYLSREEMRRARELQERSIPAEDIAFDYFPPSIKSKVVRNIPVAFINHKAFYPDFLLYEEKILIEIDDWTHDYLPRSAKDKHRDQVFKEHGYRTLRFKVKELKKKDMFLIHLGRELLDCGMAI